MPRHFEPGNPGRPKGAISKTTKLVKEVFAQAFDELQKDPAVNLVAWGKKEPTEFYKLASKLIPIQMGITGNFSITDEPITFE